MQCSCGTSYADNDEQWQFIDVLPSRTDAGAPMHRVYAAACPDCGVVGIKCFFDDRYQRLTYANVTSASHIWPKLLGASRAPVDLEGVPERIASDYRKAIESLDSASLYGYANVLVRRSLEATLERSGYAKEGKDRPRLVELIGELEKRSEGTPKGIMDNLDAIRKLGNYDAHLWDDEHGQPIEPSLEETSWNVTLFERFITHFFVEPAQDKRMRDSLPNR